MNQLIKNSGPRWSKTVCAILVGNIMEHIRVDKINQWPRKRCLNSFFHFSSGCHFVRQSITICAILVEGIMENIYVAYFKLDLVQ